MPSRVRSQGHRVTLGLRLLATALAALLASPSLAGIAGPPAPPEARPEIPLLRHSREAEIRARVERILASMTVEQKVGQLLFVGFGGTEVDEGGPIERLVKGKQVGGVALFSRNIESLTQIAHFTRQIAALLPTIPPFIAVDQEGGNVVRLSEPVAAPPSNMALGAARSVELTRRAAQVQARDLWLLGFNMNLAPVLDVNSNPANPVIGIRSFGEDPALVGAHGAAYVRGLQSGGVSAVAKHFPGHGDTESDSHYDLPALPHDKTRLLAVELAPFREAIRKGGLDAVMTAHIALPAVEGRPRVPATVSRKVLTGLLREELGFKGIILTDGLEMKGIVDAYGSGTAAVKAIQAGADMVLILWTREKKEEVHQALLSAVRDGRISMARLDESVRRILTVKMRRGLFDRRPPPVEEALAVISNSSAGPAIAREIAERGLTLVRSREGLTPIDRRTHRRVVVLSADRTFDREIGRRFPESVRIRTPAVPSRARRARDLERTREAAKDADVLVVGVVNSYQARMVGQLVRTLRTPIVVVNMGSPYLIRAFPGVAGYLCTYSYRPASATAAARFLAGEIPAPGRLPVTLPGMYPLGHSAWVDPRASHGGGGGGGATSRRP